jgi:hypothetical protein
MGESLERESPATNGSYGSGVRAQVFEVIVRQAIAGAPWQAICAMPMQVNGITTKEVEAEVSRRRGGGHEPPSAPVPKKTPPSKGSGSIALALSLPSQQLSSLRAVIANLAENSDSAPADMHAQLGKVVSELDSLLITIQHLEQTTSKAASEAKLQADLERELHRTKQDFRPGDDKGPHHVDWKAPNDS